MGECREAFEKWQDREDHMSPWQLQRDEAGAYHNRHVENEWRVWQAAWNSRAPSKAERDGVLEEAADLCDRRAESLYARWRSMGRADSHLEGQADSADACGSAIREMKGRP